MEAFDISVVWQKKRYQIWKVAMKPILTYEAWETGEDDTGCHLEAFDFSVALTYEVWVTAEDVAGCLVAFDISVAPQKKS